MSFDAGALIFKIQTAGYQTFEQQMASADRAVQGVGKSGAEAAPKVEKTGTAVEQTGKKARTAKPALDEQAKSTKKVGDESASAVPKQEKQKYTTDQQTAAAKQLAAGLTIAGVAVAALVGLSVAKFAEFDKAMSNTSAAVMATAQEQHALGEAALEAGADTAYSASEAAAAQEELAKAGQSVSQIIGGSLNGALALAAAGQLQVARSAEIMATTLKQYKLPAEQAAHVSDVLAAGAGKAQGSVDDMALALSYVGPVAAGLKISLEETAGGIAYLASQGILGEKAGTGLRGVLMSLTAPSAIAARTMGEYGIEIFDANGKMKSLAEVSQILKTRLGGLTEAERSAALGRIFGNEQITAARILYDGGAKAINEWTAAVDDSGYAAEQAAMRQDNLAGDIEKLGGAFDTALIRTGSGANDVLREMVQSVTSLVDWYGELPAPIQQTALVLGVATAAIALFAGGAVVLRGKFIELKAQMDAANVSMGKTALVGGAASLALAGVVAVVALLAAEHAAGKARVEAYASAIRSGTKDTEEYVAQQLALNDSYLWFDTGNAVDNAEKLGITTRELTEALSASDSEYEAFVARVQGLGGEFGDTATAANQLIDKTDQLRADQESAEKQIRATDSAQKSLTGSTDENAGSVASAADAYMEASDQAADLESNLSRLIDRINEANGVGQDAISSNIDYKNALAEVDDVIRKATEGLDENEDGIADYILTLDQSTQAGRDNMGMLVGLAAQSRQAADDQFALDGNTQAYWETLQRSRQEVYDRAVALGMNADEAGALADKIAGIPTETEWKAIINARDAQLQIDKFVYQNSGREIIVKIGTSRVAQGAGGAGGITQADGAVVTYHANGSVSENHVAQIARAGDWRVWAEPETGGESYVPHAPEKRARSEQIMAETAAILGGVYIPAGAAMLADGATSPTSQPVGTGIRPGDRIVFEIEGMPLTAIAKRVVSGYENERLQADARGYGGGI